MNRSTLLDQARLLAGTGALVIAPLALAPQLRAVAIIPPTFNPNATVTYSTGSYATKASGNIAGTALPPTADGTTGVKFTGDAIYNFAQTSGGSISPAVSFNGTGTGGFQPNQSLPVRYFFDLSTSSAADVVSSFQFTLSLSTSSGSFSRSFTDGDVPGFVPFSGTKTFSYNSQIVLDGLGSGGGFQGYAGNLVVNFSDAKPGDTFTLHIPDGSVDFNPIPEPATNALLLGGAALLGAVTAVRRRRQPQAS